MRVRTSTSMASISSRAMCCQGRHAGRPEGDMFIGLATVPETSGLRTGPDRGWRRRIHHHLVARPRCRPSPNRASRVACVACTITGLVGSAAAPRARVGPRGPGKSPQPGQLTGSAVHAKRPLESRVAGGVAAGVDQAAERTAGTPVRETRPSTSLKQPRADHPPAARASRR